MSDSLPDTVDALLRHHAPSTKPMVIDPDTRIGYAELDTSTRELAAGLMVAGSTREHVSV